MKNVVILGASGSIGKQALEIIGQYPSEFKVIGVSVNKSIHVLEDIIQKHNPNVIGITDVYSGQEYLKQNNKKTKCQIEIGEDASIVLATISEADIVLNAIVGFAGLKASLATIRLGKTLALANKESLVVGGQLLINEAKKHNAKILPVDSEHSAIFQCLGEKHEKLSRILLTASGGPFRGYSKEKIENVTLKQALKHPNWSMGAKITIDSATMMNKGLEMIEARWLFDLDPENIEMVVHKQSIIHSMVEFEDGSILAQMGVPTMQLPILYALSYPKRYKTEIERLNFSMLKQLDFEAPDSDVFSCISLAYQAAKCEGTMPAVMNAANEAAVQLFLEKKIKFTDIPKLIEESMNKHNNKQVYELDEIIALSNSVYNAIV